MSGSDREPAAGSTPGKWATRLAVATACATWILLLVGCLVHGTGSSLACPDWPLCHGTAFPKMENGVQYGDLTKAAIKWFQGHTFDAVNVDPDGPSLIVDGVPGPATWAAIDAKLTSQGVSA